MKKVNTMQIRKSTGLCTSSYGGVGRWGGEEPYLQQEGEGQGPLQYIGEQSDEEGDDLTDDMDGQGRRHNDVPFINSTKMAKEFSEEPNTIVLHYFLNSDLADLNVTKHVGAWTHASMSPLPS